MKELINALYELQVNAEFPCFEKNDKESTRREWELYLLLQEELPITTKKLFAEYVDLITSRHNLETKAAFEQGFKSAFSLLIEVLKN